LSTWLISRPLIPGMELSVRTRSCDLGSNTRKASSAFRTACTIYPKLLRNHRVMTRVSSRSSTRRIVLQDVGDSLFMLQLFSAPCVACAGELVSENTDEPGSHHGPVRARALTSKLRSALCRTVPQSATTMVRSRHCYRGLAVFVHASLGHSWT
jgi:hypothetical protein